MPGSSWRNAMQPAAWSAYRASNNRPLGGAVSARKVFQLLIETLEAQAEAERTAIFEEEAARFFDVFGERGLKQIDLGSVIAVALITTTQSFC
jgi:hypothetical protein